MRSKWRHVGISALAQLASAQLRVQARAAKTASRLRKAVAGGQGSADVDHQTSLHIRAYESCIEGLVTGGPKFM